MARASGGGSVAAATGAATLGHADVGHAIRRGRRLQLDGHRYAGARGSSAAAGRGCQAVNDAPTGSVTITGTATEDQTLTASNTLADADGLGTISYQWQRDGVDIAGATGTTYTLGDADVGAHDQRGGELHRRPRHGGERDQCGDRGGRQRQRRADRDGDDQRARRRKTRR